ncbi:MAG: DUF4097 family beta strand repeat-containing protein [Actinomycetota bacterium]
MSQFRFQVGAVATLGVRLAAGRFDIQPNTNGEILVEVSGSDADFVAVDQLGDVVTIREERRLFGGRTVNVRAAVPVGTNLEVGVASMDVVSRVQLGRVIGHTASGDLVLSDVASAELKTASGDVKLETCSGLCEVSSASGDVRAKEIGGDLVVSTASGDVNVERVLGRLTAKSASGDVTVRACAGTSAEVSSMSGDVYLGVPAGTRVEAEINTLSGRVRTPSTKSGQEEPTRKLRLRAKTVSGDIELSRTDPIT